MNTANDKYIVCPVAATRKTLLSFILVLVCCFTVFASYFISDSQSFTGYADVSAF